MNTPSYINPPHLEGGVFFFRVAHGRLNGANFKIPSEERVSCPAFHRSESAWHCPLYPGSPSALVEIRDTKPFSDVTK